ncbi:MAG: TetR family transcriptional regulator C-terminal domain-containing protein [Cytophagales bacterium]|nr:TetR family transcriptional regulator C-terminal domain-containing protein [Bernardetiaceae bacterium]MDW8204970.1 TetR family transcriptional regulator C-terminal domain-containing protein [Cytophagales bacterium]
MEQIKKEYIRYLLNHGKRPASVFAFMQSINMEEKTFYEHYASFDALEAAIWGDAFNDTVAKLQNDNVYDQYNAREKMLAMYYGYVETLKNIRSFAQKTYAQRNTVERRLCGKPDLLADLKKNFDDFVKKIINDAIYTGEIVDRPFLTDRYAQLLWWQMEFIINFWIQDNSRGFEKTDAAIEKAVNLAFDLLGKNIADTTVDFIKFVFAR